MFRENEFKTVIGFLVAIVALTIEDIGSNINSQLKKKIMILSGFP